MISPSQIFQQLTRRHKHVTVVGLGYVGFPLFSAISSLDRYNVVGFDISDKALQRADGPARITTKSTRDAFKDAGLIIVTVPTPVEHGTSTIDLKPIMDAAKMIGETAQPGFIVCLESTAYPGITEEMCMEITKHNPNLVPGKDFFFGYSPERITPGDAAHYLSNTNKIVSGCDHETGNVLRDFYKQIVTSAEVYLAPNVQVAEAAKVLENVQRDVNIALMNDMSKGFEAIGVSLAETLKAAGTKWNFGKYTPGLVGGHCIAVDPWYLQHKFKQFGYESPFINLARSVSDGVVDRVVDVVKAYTSNIKGPVVHQYGITYKPDIDDVRDSRALEIAQKLKLYIGATNHRAVDNYYSMQSRNTVEGLYVSREEPLGPADVILITTPHTRNRKYFDIVNDSLRPGGLLVDLYNVIDKHTLEGKFKYWSL